jgi:hypothetical protein
MPQTLSDVILKWVMDARNSAGFEHVDDPALMLLIVKKAIANLPGQRMQRREAEQIYRTLRKAADEYTTLHPEMQIFGAYDTPLAKIRILLERASRGTP